MKQKLVSTNKEVASSINRMAFTLKTETHSYSLEEKLTLLNQLEMFTSANKAEYAYAESVFITVKNARENNEINNAQYKTIKTRANQLAKLLNPTEAMLSLVQQKQIIVLTFQLWKNNLAGLPTAEGIATPNILYTLEKIIAFLGNKTPVDRLQFCKDLAILCSNLKQANIITFITEAATLLPALWTEIGQQNNIPYENVRAVTQDAILFATQELATQHLTAIILAQEKQTKQLEENKVILTERKIVSVAKSIVTIPKKICPTVGLTLTEIIEKITVSRNNYTNLNLDYLNFSDNETQALAKALMHKNCRLTRLIFRMTNISDIGTKFLSEALAHPNCQLTSLDLKFNDIGVAGTQALANVLKHENCKLTTLALNGILGIAIQPLSDALKHENCKLTLLDLSYNELSDVAVQALTNALIHENCRLTGIYMTIPNTEMETFETALKHPMCKIFKYEGNFSPDDQLKQIFKQRHLAYTQSNGPNP